MPKMSRRQVLQMSGVALIGSLGQKTPAPTVASNATQLSAAENLFWSEVMMDHAEFLTMMLPGDDLAAERAQAEDFRRKFKGSSLQTTIDLLKPFIAYKRQLFAAQTAGMIHTLAWPMFFDHTAREAERALARLEKLAAGDASLEYSEVVEFWSGIMSDHGQLIAHLLDPKEQDLISAALDSSAQYQGFQLANRSEKGMGQVELLVATEELINFKEAAARGVSSGAIRCMMTPKFIDHLRREALKFVDELKRTVRKT